jgi:transcriptional regulator with XRE-family HTH domain
MSIGTRIKELRKKHGLNQTELGKIVGLSHGTLAGIESGNNNATTETIIKLCEYFKVSSDYLLFGIETEQTISESEQEILNVLREDKAMTNAVMEFAKVKKKAISFTRSYAAASQNAAMG